MTIRVTIFEDNRKYRDSLAMLIDGTPGFTLAGAFPGANDAVNNIDKTQPDVVLMDIEMPGTSGIEALIEIKKVHPALNILMQTVFQDDDKVFESICNGASGYVLKNTPPARILEAIAEAYHGGAPMSPVIARKVLYRLQEQKPVQPDAAEQIMLTPREKEVLSHMVDGLSYKMIADRCDISYETVRTHIRNIYEKLHVATMTEAVVKALRSGLV
jgi:DNA-binding NarL/FixJ family response regulator